VGKRSRQLNLNLPLFLTLTWTTDHQRENSRVGVSFEATLR